MSARPSFFLRNLALLSLTLSCCCRAVSGAAGCSEMHEPFTKPQPPRSAFRSNTFGYSKLWIHNATHVRWQQIVTDPTFFGPDQYGMVVDDTWVIQHHHGPFSNATAPTGVPLCEDDSGGVGGCGKSFDHWAGREDAAGMVEIEPGSIWHRLQHDKPVSMSPEEDAELLSVSRKIIGCISKGSSNGRADRSSMRTSGSARRRRRWRRRGPGSGTRCVRAPCGRTSAPRDECRSPALPVLFVIYEVLDLEAVLIW